MKALDLSFKIQRDALPAPRAGCRGGLAVPTTDFPASTNTRTFTFAGGTSGVAAIELERPIQSCVLVAFALGRARFETKGPIGNPLGFRLLEANSKFRLRLAAACHNDRDLHFCEQ